MRNGPLRGEGEDGESEVGVRGGSDQARQAVAVTLQKSMQRRFVISLAILMRHRPRPG